MKITTSKGKTFDVLWCWAPVGATGSMMIRLRDGRPLPDIAADFDGCDHFHRESDEEGNMDFDGYSLLTGIVRQSLMTDALSVTLTLNKPVEV